MIYSKALNVKQYHGSMKTKMKTSLTLSREVVRGIDRVAGKKHSRSAVVRDMLRGYLSHRERAATNGRDVLPRIG
jgi:metal-responsive CopG/Arc/MetJ family transcriptional regulator